MFVQKNGLPYYFIFAFADNEAYPLEGLQQEREELRSIFNEVEHQFKIAIIYHATAQKIISLLQEKKIRDRLIGFHYAGHAGGTHLMLNNKEGDLISADGEALIDMLGTCNELRFTFFNGCSTRALVEGLHLSGIKDVIATKRAIEDEQAVKFSQIFYSELIIQKANLHQSFLFAQNAIRFSKSDKTVVSRGRLNLSPSLEDSFPWGIYSYDRDKTETKKLPALPIPVSRLKGKIVNEEIGGQGISGINISVENITAVNSGINGNFILEMEDLYPGQEIPFIAVQAPGKQIVNPEVLRHVLIPEYPTREIEIILCPEGKRYEFALLYYRIRLEKEVDNMFKTKLSEGEDIDKLLKERDIAKEQADEMARQIASIDFEAYGERFRRAFSFFPQQPEKVQEILKEELLDADRKLLKMQKDKLDQAAKDNAESYMLLGRAHELQFNWEAAYNTYKNVIEAYPNNFKNLEYFVKFLDKQNENKEQLVYAKKLIEVASNENEKGIAFNILGLAFVNMNDYKGSISSFDKAIEIKQKLVRENFPESESGLAMTLNNLGISKRNLNQFEEARNAYQEALKLYRKLRKDQSGSSNFISELVTTLNNLGIVQRDLNEFNQALSSFEEALEIGAKLLSSGKPDDKADLAATFNNISLVYSDLNQDQKAISFYQKALEIYQNLAENNPARYRGVVAMNLNNLGIIYRKGNQLQEALSAFTDSFKIRKKLASVKPARFEPDLASTLNNLGLIYADLKQFEESIKAYKEALTLLERLKESNEEKFAPELALTSNNLGLLFAELKRFNESLTVYKKSLKIFRNLAQINPGRFNPDLAATLNNIGRILTEIHEYSEALHVYQNALKLHKELHTINAKRYAPAIASNLSNLGIVYRKLNNYQKALLSYQEALVIRRKLAKENPSRFNPNIATTLNNMGIVYRYLNDYEESKNCYLEAISLTRELVQDNSLRFKPELAMTLNNLGITYQKLKDSDKALAVYNESLEIRRELALHNLDKYEVDIAHTLNNLGIIYRTKGDFEKALSSHKEANTIFQKYAQKDQDRYKPDLAMTLNNVGTVYKYMNHFPEAIESYELAMATYKDLAENSFSPTRFQMQFLMVANNLGSLYRKTDEIKKAITNYKQSIYLGEGLVQAHPRSFAPHLAYAHTTMGDIMINQGPEYGLALNHYQKALDTYQLLRKHTNTKKEEIIIHKRIMKYGLFAGQYDQTLASSIILKEAFPNDLQIKSSYIIASLLTQPAEGEKHFLKELKNNQELVDNIEMSLGKLIEEANEKGSLERISKLINEETGK